MEDSIWSLRNSHNAIWGKVLTDGIYVNGTVHMVSFYSNTNHIKEHGHLFSNVTFRVKKDLERLTFDSDFPILDIAYADGYTIPY